MSKPVALIVGVLMISWALIGAEDVLPTTGVAQRDVLVEHGSMNRILADQHIAEEGHNTSRVFERASYNDSFGTSDTFHAQPPSVSSDSSPSDVCTNSANLKNLQDDFTEVRGALEGQLHFLQDSLHSSSLEIRLVKEQTGRMLRELLDLKGQLTSSLCADGEERRRIRRRRRAKRGHSSGSDGGNLGSALHVVTGSAPSLCPSPFQSHGSSCYAMVQEHRDWKEATHACRLLGSHLAEPRDMENLQSFVSVALARTDYTLERLWIGAHLRPRTHIQERGMMFLEEQKEATHERNTDAGHSGRRKKGVPNHMSGRSQNNRPRRKACVVLDPARGESRTTIVPCQHRHWFVCQRG